MAEEKKFPSVPSNYVSILQLQERWIKQKQLEKEKQEQQEQRRREEEEEQKRLKQEQRRRQDEEEEERKRLKQVRDDQKCKQDGKKRCEESNITDSVAPPPSRKTRTPYRRRIIVAANRPIPEEAEKVKDEADVEAKPETVVVVVGEVVRDGEGKTDDAKKKWKQDDQKNKQDGKKSCEDSNVTDSVAPPPSRKTRPPKNRRNIVAASRPKPEEAEEVKDEADVEAKPETVVVVVGEVVRDGEGKTDDAKRKRKKKGKYKKEEALIGDMEPVMEVVVVEEENVPARRNGERKGKRSEWQWKSVNVVANGKVVEANDDPTVEIGQKLEEVELEQKFGELSVNRRKGGGKEKARLRSERNGGGRRMDSGRFGGLEWGVRRPRDGSLVWVKKEEVPDGNVA